MIPWREQGGAAWALVNRLTCSSTNPFREKWPRKDVKWETVVIIEAYMVAECSGPGPRVLSTHNQAVPPVQATAYLSHQASPKQHERNRTYGF